VNNDLPYAMAASAGLLDLGGAGVPTSTTAATSINAATYTLGATGSCNTLWAAPDLWKDEAMHLTMWHWHWLIYAVCAALQQRPWLYTVATFTALGIFMIVNIGYQTWWLAARCTVLSKIHFFE
jgi:hypothetical protein